MVPCRTRPKRLATHRACDAVVPYSVTMLRQTTTTLSFETRGRSLLEITEPVLDRVSEAGLESGLLTLFVRHASASLLVQENADPDVRSDLDRFFARLVPDGDPLFRHRDEGADDMPAHVRAALTAVQLSVPIVQGRRVLSTWQGLYLWEHRTRPHRREIVLHLLGE
jgi:secondary thiamine-phosphate synthase enzyme